MKIYSKFFELQKKIMPNYAVSYFVHCEKGPSITTKDIKFSVVAKKDKNVVSNNRITCLSTLSLFGASCFVVRKSLKNMDILSFCSHNFTKIHYFMDILLYIISASLQKQSVNLVVTKTTSSTEFSFSDLSYLNNWYLLDVEIGSFEEFKIITVLASKPDAIRIFNFTRFFFNI